MRMLSRLYVFGLATAVACSYDARQLAGPPAGGLGGSVLGIDGALAGTGGMGGAGVILADTALVPPDARPADVGLVKTDLAGTPDLPLATGGGMGSGGVIGTGGATGIERGPEPGPDASSQNDANWASTCTLFWGSQPSSGTAGHPPMVGTLAAACIATCDDIAGWGCSNFAGRTVTVNGTSVNCGDAITKANGYYVFRLSAGTMTTASLFWWGTYATSCSPPAGGFPP